MSEKELPEQTDETVGSYEVMASDELNAIADAAKNMSETAENLVVPLGNADLYKEAKNVRKELKSTISSIEKKRKELKEPVLIAGKRIDAYAKELKERLKVGFDAVDVKIKKYEEERDRKKREEKEAKEREIAKAERINQMLHDLNAYLPKINACETKSELEAIQKEIEAVVPSEFGEQESQASFIRMNLLDTCTIVSARLPESVVKEPAPVNDLPPSNGAIPKQDEPEVEDKQEPLEPEQEPEAEDQKEPQPSIFESEPSEPKEPAKEEESENAQEGNAKMEIPEIDGAAGWVGKKHAVLIELPQMDGNDEQYNAPQELEVLVMNVMNGKHQNFKYKLQND